MKEVRLRYPAHAIANSEFKDQISICQEAVLMASVSRQHEKTPSSTCFNSRSLRG